MIPNTISDTFQPIIDFSYGLDVEIRPKSGGAHRAPPGASLIWLTLATALQAREANLYKLDSLVVGAPLAKVEISQDEV